MGIERKTIRRDLVLSSVYRSADAERNYVTFQRLQESKKCNKGEIMEITNNKGLGNTGITITFNGGELLLNSVEEICKLMETIEIHCWGSSSYSEL